MEDSLYDEVWTIRRDGFSLLSGSGGAAETVRGWSPCGHITSALGTLCVAAVLRDN